MRVLRHGVPTWFRRVLRNRQDLVKAGVTRRDLVKMGLITTGGLLAYKPGLSRPAWAGDTTISPPTRKFIEPLPTHMNGGMKIAQPVAALSPAPSVAPNTAAGERRTRNHQALTRFAPAKLYELRQEAVQAFHSPDLPRQTAWGFSGTSPGPTFVARYGEPILVRNFNNLPADNGGFGLPSVSTHLHNGHTPSESDGFPCDYFDRGTWYDYHYPNVLAGFDSTHGPTGDINESLSTLWYHDHRIEFTAQNAYKGLAGFYLLFNQFDTGDETTGFRLPSFPDYDVPLMLNDKLYDPDTGLLTFDLFNSDGMLGEKFLVNGKIQPYFEVKKRRYRFRILNGGPSRFYQVFLTDPANPGTSIPFYVVANDGNLLPKPVKVTSARLSVAERRDIIVDFNDIPGNPSRLVLENRLPQTDGQRPDDKLHPAGKGDFLLEFRVGERVTDNSVDPATGPSYYALPNRTDKPRVTREFDFDKKNGQWAVNNQLITGDCGSPRFTVQKNSVEKWVFKGAGGWAHPVHVHFEEFQILSRNGNAVKSGVEYSRKDVVELPDSDRVEVLFRFRDFDGRYVMHCHNTVHEDHAMMLRFDIGAVGDTKSKP
jgi:FtsP/CotA-like multicopper oxidase with cupredoxin domain